MPQANSRVTKLPAIPGLTEKPASIKSGKSLKDVRIFYRSDLYMHEQYNYVNSFQSQLRDALNDLKLAKPESLDYHTERVKYLKVKTDEMIIVLQVCGKINRELVYARRDLKSSIENAADSKIINKHRKRVQWLEGKLEQIIIKNSPSMQDEQVEDSIHRMSVSGGPSRMEKSAMSSVPVGASRLPTAESENRLNTATTGQSKIQVNVGEVYMDQLIIGSSTSGDRLVISSSTGRDVRKESHQDSNQLLPSPITKQKLEKSDSRSSFRGPTEDDVAAHITRKSSLYSESDRRNESALKDDDGDLRDRSRLSVVSSLFTDVTDEGTRNAQSGAAQSHHTSPIKQPVAELSREVSKVLVKSPEVDRQRSENAYSGLSRSLSGSAESLRSTSINLSEPCYDADSTEDYWASEHHRVEFSTLHPFLNEIDPNSLHQVALSVPGNYVAKPSPERTSRLPWREAEDNNDVNREALDSLGKQLVDMQDKVYEAAMKSIDSAQSRMMTAMSAGGFSSVAKAAGKAAMFSREVTKISQNKSSTLPVLSEAGEEVQRFAQMVHLQYHSKEIPPAKTLPITRVNRKKIYPQPISSYVFPDPDGRPAPERLVNQGQLYNDTRLIIYKPPVKRKKVNEEQKPIQNRSKNNQAQGQTDILQLDSKPSKASNRRKLELKQKHRFSRAPLLDLDIVKESQNEWRERANLDYGVSKIIGKCVLCQGSKCLSGCPLRYDTKPCRPTVIKATAHSLSVDVSRSSLLEKLHHNDLHYARSIDTIQRKHEQNLLEIDEWIFANSLQSDETRNMSPGTEKLAGSSNRNEKTPMLSEKQLKNKRKYDKIGRNLEKMHRNTYQTPMSYKLPVTARSTPLSLWQNIGDHDVTHPTSHSSTELKFSTTKLTEYHQSPNLKLTCPKPCALGVTPDAFNYQVFENSRIKNEKELSNLSSLVKHITEFSTSKKAVAFSCASVEVPSSLHVHETHESCSKKPRPFSLIFGDTTLDLIRTRRKRIERNRLLSQKCHLRPRFCEGDGRCSVCAGKSLLSTNFADSLNTNTFQQNDVLNLSTNQSRCRNRLHVMMRTAGNFAMAVDSFRSFANISQSADVDLDLAEKGSGYVSVSHTGFRWQRVKDLIENGLQSKYADERVDAAKQLGLLRCTDPTVFTSLKVAIFEDSEERVQYESAKSLITLGCHENEIVQILVDYLIIGNDSVRLDMLKCLINAQDISFINKQMPAFTDLVKVLENLCEGDDAVSFQAAIAFGKICVKNTHAVERMMSYLHSSDDTHGKAVALRILVKQFNESDVELVDAVLRQFTSSPVREYRREAALLLQHMGRKHTCQDAEREELVYSTLEQRLWSDSVELVRLEAAKTLAILDLYPRAVETMIKQLSDKDASLRAHAVISVGTLGIKQSKVLRNLAEMLELDPSDQVRKEIIRAFGALKVTDKNIIRVLKEKEKGEGVLAVEAKRVLQSLETAL